MRSRQPHRNPPTTASKRKKRRHPRRDIRRGGDYTPTPINPQAAKQAASGRLWLATGSASLTVTALVAAMVSTQGPYALAALVILAFFSFNATIALILSARREEAVHGLFGM
ncbi:MAG: hypothetical protein R3E66_19210 [bacterium]